MTDGPESMRIGLINCEPLPEPDPDEAPTLAAFRAAGHHAESIAWNTVAGADLSSFDACLLRATWDYYQDIDRFLAWTAAASLQTRLLNDPAIVRWNHHKGYLLELERAGIAVIPTELARKGISLDVVQLAADRGWKDGIVVKPAVGAGSWHARRFEQTRLDDAQGWFDSLACERDGIVQPVIPGFADPGERCLIWIDGEWTHAIRKRPRYAGENESVISGGPATSEERQLGDRVLAEIPGKPLYARLDVVRGEVTGGRGGDGLLVSELELIEPSLFFFCNGGERAARALVKATEGAVRRLSRPPARA